MKSSNAISIPIPNSNLTFKAGPNQSNRDSAVDIPNQYHLISMKQITQLIGMTDKWIYSLIQKQQFPKPIKLGRSSRWRLSEIEAWIDRQVTQP